MEIDDYWLLFPEIVAAGERATELLNLEPVTPRLTAALVRAGIAAGWRPEATGEPLHFSMAGDRTAFVLVAEASR
ncbi:hypothetical protein [Saccharothrix sp. ST-888]|uniref:hypothetical protein n=1 Tax=Saccharothrix sp. ST-888 TaxID=1427391 RepID=UPI0005ECFF10|nr:hypothetical protein [Saccharothrix sp. ST-888]KJK58006.1 hypothetical protein UK12_13140 [Saccharothrix sp. ST-888]